MLKRRKITTVLSDRPHISEIMRFSVTEVIGVTEVMGCHGDDGEYKNSLHLKDWTRRKLEFRGREFFGQISYYLQ